MAKLRPIPDEGTIEYIDYLLEALVEEVLIYAQFDTSEEPVNLHIGMLRAAYMKAMERKAANEDGQPLLVVADPEAAVVEMMGMRLPVEQARDLGEKLLQAASMVEFINPGREGDARDEG